MEVQLYTDHLLTVSSKCHSHPLTLTYNCRSIESELLATLTITNPQPTKQSRITSAYSLILRVNTLKYMQLIKLHTTIPTHSQLHQAGITSTYSFQSKYLKVHATALNYTNPQPTTPSYTYLLWFTFKCINYFPESTLVLAVLSYINPHSTMPIYTQLHRTILEQYWNNTE